MSIITLDAATSILRERFGRKEFRSNQFEIISSLLQNRDALVILPTGHGKSLTYQLPAVYQHGRNKSFSVVVSPLLALISDQVNQLLKLGIPVATLNSTLPSEERQQVLSNLKRNVYCLLYVSPEQCLSSFFLKLLKECSTKIQRIVVDEAHCAVEWGSDFRLDYARLGAELRPVLPNVPVVALTGTASPRMQEQIIKTLGLHNPLSFVASTNRPHLHYEVRYIESSYDKLDDLKKFLRIYRLRIQKLGFYKPPTKTEQSTASKYPGCGIIYCRSRRTTEEVAEQLNAELGNFAVAYHAGLSTSERNEIMHKWINGNYDHAVIVATIAFGLGIDKADTRFVVHFDLPQNMEAYVQQTGRGGRDGKACRCILYFSSEDAIMCLKYARQHKNSEEATSATLSLIKFANAIDCCRHASLGKYFSEEVDMCDFACDFCKSRQRLNTRYAEWKNGSQ